MLKLLRLNVVVYALAHNRSVPGMVGFPFWNNKVPIVP